MLNKINKDTKQKKTQWSALGSILVLNNIIPHNILLTCIFLKRDQVHLNQTSFLHKYLKGQSIFVNTITIDQLFIHSFQLVQTIMESHF